MHLPFFNPCPPYSSVWLPLGSIQGQPFSVISGRQDLQSARTCENLFGIFLSMAVVAGPKASLAERSVASRFGLGLPNRHRSTQRGVWCLGHAGGMVRLKLLLPSIRFSLPACQGILSLIQGFTPSMELQPVYNIEAKREYVSGHRAKNIRNWLFLVFC